MNKKAASQTSLLPVGILRDITNIPKGGNIHKLEKEIDLYGDSSVDENYKKLTVQSKPSLYDIDFNDPRNVAKLQSQIKSYMALNRQLTEENAKINNSAQTYCANVKSMQARVNQMEALRKTFKSEKENAESQLKTIQITQNSQVSTIEELSKEIAVLKSRLETKIENRDQNQSPADLDKIFKLQTELVEVGIQQENLKYEMQETLNSLLEHKKQALDSHEKFLKIAQISLENEDEHLKELADIKEKLEKSLKNN